MEVLAVVLALAGVPLGAMVAVWRGREAWRRLCGRRVVVSLRSGQSIDGVLVERRADFLFVKGASLMDPASSGPVPMDGEAVIDRDQVDFVQVL